MAESEDVDIVNGGGWDSGVGPLVLGVGKDGAGEGEGRLEVWVGGDDAETCSFFG